MATINVAQYQTWVRNKLGDQSFDSATLIQFAYETNKFIVNTARWPFMEQLFTGTIDTSHNTYNWPAGCQVPVDLALVSPDSTATYLDYIPYVEFDERYPDTAKTNLAPSTPYLWTTFANTYIVGPTFPDQVYTLRMRYLSSPKALSTDTSQTLDIPDDFSELVVLGMYVRALKANDNFDQAQVEQAEFDEQLRIMKSRLLRRTLGVTPRMNMGIRPGYDW